MPSVACWVPDSILHALSTLRLLTLTSQEPSENSMALFKEKQIKAMRVSVIYVRAIAKLMSSPALHLGRSNPAVAPSRGRKQRGVLCFTPEDKCRGEGPTFQGGRLLAQSRGGFGNS